MNRIITTLKTLATRRLVLTFDRVYFTHSHMSWRRIFNWLAAELSYSLNSTRVRAYPTHIQIEPSNICNLRCPVCHVVTDTREQGVLKLGDFKGLIDEIGDYLLFLHFWGWGEPFLNNDFLAMVRYAKFRGIKIITSTNGHFFESSGDADRLIDSGLDVLVFALDGVDRETYEKYRHKGDFDRVLRGLKLLLARRQERGESNPVINLRMLVTNENEDQIPGMKLLAKELGVDVLTFKTLCDFDNPEKGGELLPRCGEYRRFEYDGEGKPERVKNTCKKMWNHPTVYRDGSFYTCDYHSSKDRSLGNVFNDGGGFGKIWFGTAMRELRARFLKGDTKGIRCETCPWNFSEVERFVSHAFAVSKTYSDMYPDSSKLP